jgi:adenosylhomocysteine nucleosidase
MKFLKTYILSLLFFILFSPMAYAATGIIVALDSTLKQLAKNVKVEKIHRKAEREFYEGGIGNTAIVIVRSPMGLINNAITAQLLLSLFPVKKIVSLAPAGGINPEVHVGDVIIAERVFQHDFGTFKPYGFIWGKVPDGSGWNALGYQKSDPKMREVALHVIESYRGERNSYIEGVVVSGDQFIADEAKRSWLGKKFKANAVDMGASAIAQVCYANKVPYLIIRVVTDKAGVHARVDFANATPGYRTDLRITQFITRLIVQLA